MSLLAATGIGAQTQPEVVETLTKEELRTKLLEGAYRGIQLQRLEWLRLHVPSEYRDREELEQQVSYYALDAIEVFDQSRGMKFSTFLTQHLRMKCTNYQQYLWTRSSGNCRCRMYGMVTKNTHPGISEDEVTFTAGESDLADIQRIQAMSVRSEAESLCAVQEMVSALSDESRVSLETLFAFEDQALLITALKSPHYRSRVAKATGLTTDAVDGLVNEVKRKFPSYLGV